MNAGEARDQRLAVERFELIKFRAIHQPRNHFADIVLAFQICWYKAKQFLRVVAWLNGFRECDIDGFACVEIADNPPRQR